MFHATRTTVFALSSGLLLAGPAAAQQTQPQAVQQPSQYTPQQPAQFQPQGAQPGTQQQQPAAVQQQAGQPPATGQPQQGPPAVQEAPPVQIPPAFQLNQLEQADLDSVLSAWEQSSNQIVTFRCDFERLEFNAAFGPGPGIPLNKDKGEISFNKPDKGSFQITEINTWQANPVPPGQQPPAQIQGNWVLQKDAIGEHWVCDGTNIYEYRQQQKQVVQRTLPENMRGKAIADGPLPFLFGASAASLKQKYSMKIDQATSAKTGDVWIDAIPRTQEQAANFKQVSVILDRQQLLPKAMDLHLPDGSRHTYIFDIKTATVNGPFEKIRALFQSPSVPWGWQRVKEDMPVQQAAQPIQQPR